MSFEHYSSNKLREFFDWELKEHDFVYEEAYKVTTRKLVERPQRSFSIITDVYRSGAWLKATDSVFSDV